MPYTVRSACAPSPSAATPPAPNGFGEPQVPEASTTARASRRSVRPSGVRTTSSKGAASRPADLTLSWPRRVTASTRWPVRTCGAISGSAASGSTQRASRSPPVGSASPSGIVQPRASSIAREVGSTTYFHGEKRRTCDHARMLAPTVSPASSTSGVSPRATSCAAATRPTGPAPMMATGRRPGVAADAFDWQPQVADGAEQQAPVSAFGVGSPQQGLVARTVGAAGPQQGAEAVMAGGGSGVIKNR